MNVSILKMSAFNVKVIEVQAKLRTVTVGILATPPIVKSLATAALLVIASVIVRTIVVELVVAAEETVGAIPSVATTPPTTGLSASNVAEIFPFSAYVTVGVASAANAEPRFNTKGPVFPLVKVTDVTV